MYSLLNEIAFVVLLYLCLTVPISKEVYCIINNVYIFNYICILLDV